MLKQLLNKLFGPKKQEPQPVFRIDLPNYNPKKRVMQFTLTESKQQIPKQIAQALHKINNQKVKYGVGLLTKNSDVVIEVKEVAAMDAGKFKVYSSIHPQDLDLADYVANCIKENTGLVCQGVEAVSNSVHLSHVISDIPNCASCVIEAPRNVKIDAVSAGIFAGVVLYGRKYRLI